VILGLGVWFTQEKTPSKPLAFGKRQRRRASTFKRSGATTVPAPFPAKTLQNRHFFVGATFHICNLARHVHKAFRHMAFSAHSRSLGNYRWFVALAFLILLLVARQSSNAQTAEAGQVTVTGEPVPTPTPHDNWREMRQHIMPEVSGTEITVTKKATVIKLDQQPPVENSDLQDLFLKAPGFQITDQHTPGQFNFNYRGLGNPQESEFTLVLRDGLPLMSDWIGFPTLYYLPLPQSISEIQFIRGGELSHERRTPAQKG
jgi:hypothetical protein